MSQNGEHKSPSYYVRRRLTRNKPAMVGLVLIILAHFIAFLGYLIMPDDTPYADGGSVLIQKKEPGFTCKVLLDKKDEDIPSVNLLVKVFSGQESPYRMEPVDTVFIENDSVCYMPYGDKEKTMIKQHLVDVVHSLYVGTSYDALAPGAKENHLVIGDTILFLDYHGKVQQTSIKELEKAFWENHVKENTYWLGTNKSGRDILSMLLYGTRISLSIGFISVLISLLVGVILGAAAGFYGGAIDGFVMWLMTVVWSIPSIMLVIAISLALQSQGVWAAFVAVGLTMWVEIARVVRGQIKEVKEKLFVEAARAFGLPNFRIIFNHILPNILGALIVISTANFASAILVEAGLSFLGLGVQPPMPSWGQMIKDGYDAIGTKNSWHLVVLPGICISVMVLAFNLFGNGLRDAYDPKGDN